MTKNAFVAGFCKLTDETKVMLLFAVKSFLFVWILLSYTDGAAAAFVGLNVDKAHELMVARIN
jgi:hypothetical protein